MLKFGKSSARNTLISALRSISRARRAALIPASEPPMIRIRILFAIRYAWRIVSVSRS